MTMGEKTAKRKKGSISEEDVSVLLQRYSPIAILTLLQEVSQVAVTKIDWDALVKRTMTGITSAREYQMLWRHLAYRDTLVERVEEGAEPLDDESDLEFELEAVPVASDEALFEAAACVKQALITSSLPREPGLANRTVVESPLTLNTTTDQISRVLLEKRQLPRANRSNVTVTLSGQKHPLPTGISAEGLDGNGSECSNIPPKKKRKLWTKEEDMELIAAVKRYGEGQWATILKGDFKHKLHNRTASQLSQRWAIIRKRDGAAIATSSNKSASSTRSEERLATQKAISLALDMPKSGKLSAILSGIAQPTTSGTSLVPSTALSEAAPASTPQPVNQQSSSTGAFQKVILNPLNKPRTTPKKLVAPVKPSLGPNPLIKAAAFAAGGRIATPSTAASLIKAAQSKNVVHIRPGGGARLNSPISNVSASPSANTAGLQSSNIRIIRSGVTVTTQPLANTVSVATNLSNGSQHMQGTSEKLANTHSTGSSAGAATATQQALIESCPSPASLENVEKKSIVLSAIDVDALLVEGMKDPDEIELDNMVAQDHETNMLSMDSGVGDNSGSKLCDAQATLDKQVVLLKEEIEEDKNVENKLVSPDCETAEKKAMEIDSDGEQILDGKDIELSTGETCKSPPVVSLDAQDHIMEQEQ